MTTNPHANFSFNKMSLVWTSHLAISLKWSSPSSKKKVPCVVVNKSFSPNATINMKAEFWTWAIVGAKPCIGTIDHSCTCTLIMFTIVGNVWSFQDFYHGTKFPTWVLRPFVSIKKLPHLLEIISTIVWNTPKRIHCLFSSSF